MLYRRFGRTELQMPVFSCGGMRDQIIVQTKIQPTPDPADFVQHFRESLERLCIDHVDLLAIHGVNNERQLNYALRPGGCLAAARALQKRGKARHIGFSTHGAPDLVQQAVQWDGDGGFDYVNLHWYYIYQNNWPAIEEATRRDMGVFIISPADKGGMLYQPPDRLVELCQPLHPLAFNRLWCLAHPQIHTLSIGAARPTDFDLQPEPCAGLGTGGVRPHALQLAGQRRDVVRRSARGLPGRFRHRRQHLRVAVCPTDPGVAGRSAPHALHRPEETPEPGRLNPALLKQ